jgi:hypothetical protein
VPIHKDKLIEEKIPFPNIYMVLEWIQIRSWIPMELQTKNDYAGKSQERFTGLNELVVSW